MGRIMIDYFGHSCFRVSDDKERVVFDPYEDGSVPGLKLPGNIAADVVLASHGHHDHNAVQLIQNTGRPAVYDMHKITVPHDEVNGAKRGLTDITIIDFDGIKVAHLGDLGRALTKEEHAAVSAADVVMIPCGGFYTIDCHEAWDLIQTLKSPSLKILMHYREGDRGYDVLSAIDDIMNVIPNVVRLESDTISVEKGQIPDQIITLRPRQ